MIKSENGKVEMQGNVTDLFTDLSLIVASLYEVISVMIKTQEKQYWQQLQLGFLHTN